MPMLGYGFFRQQYRLLCTILLLTIIIFFFISFSSINLIDSAHKKEKITYPPDDNQLISFPNESPLIRRYLDTVRDTVCGLTLRTQERAANGDAQHISPLDIDKRIQGLDWPLFGITMIGQSRLKNLEWALRFVIGKGVRGDFIECGVWRGGSSLFARAVFQALNVTDRHVWLADSFQGLPKARTKNDNNLWSKQEYLKVRKEKTGSMSNPFLLQVSMEEVQTNFRSFDLLDDHVHFCKGFFVDSLPQCNVTRIAVLRMDGDMYESTMDQLFNLYMKVEVGGVIIVDDFTIPECNRAIRDFRQWHNMTEEIRLISGQQSARYWVKDKQILVKMEKYKSL